jgi:hypothetical protein
MYVFWLFGDSKLFIEFINKIFIITVRTIKECLSAIAENIDFFILILYAIWIFESYATKMYNNQVVFEMKSELDLSY